MKISLKRMDENSPSLGEIEKKNNLDDNENFKKYLRKLDPRAFSHPSHFLREIPENEVHSGAP